MEKLWRVIRIPLVVLITFFAVGMLYRALNLPSAEEFVNLARDYYGRYGYTVVFVAALIEGLLFINWYFPGSAVAVIGVVFAKEAGLSVAFTVFLIMLAFFITSLINYALGKYGWYRLFLRFGLEKPLAKAHQRVERVGLPLVFFSSVHPNISALTATSCGVLSLSFRDFCFYSAIGLAFWGTLWGVIIYYFGSQLIAWGTVNAMVIVVGLYIVYLIFQHWLAERKQLPSE
jgi:membrane protein DedA with SNARE-associated domain